MPNHVGDDRFQPGGSPQGGYFPLKGTKMAPNPPAVRTDYPTRRVEDRCCHRARLYQSELRRLTKVILPMGNIYFGHLLDRE